MPPASDYLWEGGGGWTGAVRVGVAQSGGMSVWRRFGGGETYLSYQFQKDAVHALEGLKCLLALMAGQRSLREAFTGIRHPEDQLYGI